MHAVAGSFGYRSLIITKTVGYVKAQCECGRVSLEKILCLFFVNV